MASENKRFLPERASHYAVFERDQVLTAGQLNSVSSWLDDETRLSRVTLLGVGIVCGLEARLGRNEIAVTHGVGVTTDGDLVWFPSNQRYVAFRRFVPAATPAVAEATALEPAGAEAFELLTEARAAEPGALPLADFGAGPASLLSMAVLVLVESVEHDLDACTATGCDNLGRNVSFDQRVLLITAERAAELARTPLESAPELTPIETPRLLVTPTIGDFANLALAYEKTNDALRANLAPALDRIVQQSALAGVIDPRDLAEWPTRIDATVRGDAASAQYCYAFLKDLVATVNELIDALDGLGDGCCPDLAMFPKHLIAGGFTPATQLLRTPFFPSALTRFNAERRDRARFLMRRLDAQIRTFRVPASPAAGIRITPSRSEARNLGERAIPFYYSGLGALIHETWSYPLSRRKGEKLIRGYWATSWNGSAEPARQQISGNDFFRIEGHIGLPASRAVPAIEGEIRRLNLPLRVRAVLLGGERKDLVVPPKRRQTDLHRFHYLLRQDVSHQVADTQAFSEGLSADFLAKRESLFMGEPDSASTNAIPRHDDVAQSVSTLRTATSEIRTALALGRAPRAAQAVLNRDLSTAVGKVRDIKTTLGVVVKTDFPSPIDKLIASPHLHWIDWVGGMLDDKEKSDDEKLLFEKFVANNPGVEHAGGAPSGGTFVMVYDASGIAVADFALPYWSCDEEEPEPAQELPLPPPRVQIPEIRVRPPIRFEPVRPRNLLEELPRLLATYETDLIKRFPAAFTPPAGGGAGPRDPAAIGAGIRDALFREYQVPQRFGGPSDPFLLQNEVNTIRTKDAQLEIERAALDVMAAGPERVAKEAAVSRLEGERAAAAVGLASALAGNAAALETPAAEVALVEVARSLNTMSDAQRAVVVEATRGKTAGASFETAINRTGVLRVPFQK